MLLTLLFKSVNNAFYNISQLSTQVVAIQQSSLTDPAGGAISTAEGEKSAEQLLEVIR